MEFLVLGLTGKRGSGKDTMADYLKAKYGFRVLTYTNDVLAPILKGQGKEVTRENLIALALNLRASGGKHIITKLLCEKIEARGLWAVSGVRYPEEVDYFKEKFGRAFVLVEVCCHIEKRHERVVKRGTKGEGHMTMGEFMAIEEKETEKVINDTIKLAALRIENNGSVNDFRRKIDALAKKLGIPAISR
jgi:dephospho-CoA kinase